MVTKLIDVAKVLRSKNAGPLFLTFDIMFDTPQELQTVMASGVITQDIIAELYGVKNHEVSIIPYEIVNSIKITIPRKHVSGDISDGDIYGCQQHMKLAELALPL